MLPLEGYSSTSSPSVKLIFITLPFFLSHLCALLLLPCSEDLAGYLFLPSSVHILYSTSPSTYVSSILKCLPPPINFFSGVESSKGAGHLFGDRVFFCEVREDGVFPFINSCALWYGITREILAERITFRKLTSFQISSFTLIQEKLC